MRAFKWRFRPLAIGLFAGACGLVSVAAAQTASASDGWRWTVVPYAFLPVSTTGTSTIAGSEADIDLELGDVFEALNLALAGRIEAWHGDFGVIADLYYTNIGGDAAQSFVGSAATATRVDVEARQGWFAVSAGYRLAEGELGPATQRYVVEASAGARFNILDQNAKLRILAGPDGRTVRTRNLGGTETWVEPTFGLRGAIDLSDRWTLGARGEVGGFGAGGNDLQWLVLVGAEYRAWDNTSLRIGWQTYGIDFSTRRADGRFAYDVIQTGPYLGLAYRF